MPCRWCCTFCMASWLQFTVQILQKCKCRLKSTELPVFYCLQCGKNLGHCIHTREQSCKWKMKATVRDILENAFVGNFSWLHFSSLFVTCELYGDLCHTDACTYAHAHTSEMPRNYINMLLLKCVEKQALEYITCYMYELVGIDKPSSPFSSCPRGLILTISYPGE